MKTNRCRSHPVKHGPCHASRMRVSSVKSDRSQVHASETQRGPSQETVEPWQGCHAPGSSRTFLHSANGALRSLADCSDLLPIRTDDPLNLRLSGRLPPRGAPTRYSGRGANAVAAARPCAERMPWQPCDRSLPVEAELTDSLSRVLCRNRSGLGARASLARPRSLCVSTQATPHSTRFVRLHSRH